MLKFEEISQIALAIMMTGCYYGTTNHEKLWIDLLQRVANFQGERSGSVILLNLRRYPASLLLYAGGIAAVAGEHHGTLLGLLSKPKVINHRRGNNESPLLLLAPYEVLGKDDANQALGTTWFAPLSEHLFRLFREQFRAILPDDRQYQQCFDQFEYMRTLLEVDLVGDVQSVGCYGWRFKRPWEDIRPEIAKAEGAVGRNWAPYQAGWFSGKRERFMTAKNKVDEMVAQLPTH